MNVPIPHVMTIRQPANRPHATKDMPYNESLHRTADGAVQAFLLRIMSYSRISE